MMKMYKMVDEEVDARWKLNKTRKSPNKNEMKKNISLALFCVFIERNKTDSKVFAFCQWYPLKW